MSQVSLTNVVMTSMLSAIMLFPALSIGKSVPNEAVFVVSTPQPDTSYNLSQHVILLGNLLQPVPPEIYSFRVHAEIKHRYSRTVVTSRMANKDFSRAQEVTFSVVLPETAFISKFVMEIDNQTYEAYVKQKDEARQDYVRARNLGLSAALVAKSTRNSNLFTVNVNIKPESKVSFQLTYEELLSRTLGCYQQAIDIQPDQLFSIKDYQIVVNIQDTQNLAFVRVPRLGNDIDANSTAEDNPDVVIRRPASNQATIFWDPVNSLDKYLTWNDTTGKFVVEYDVQRHGDAGDILMMQGYFVHFFAPTNLKPLKKHVVFVLDISGSMRGRRMAQMKESQLKILDDLSPDDYFNILTFSSNVNIWSPNSVGRKSSEPLPSTTSNIRQAKKFIQKLSEGGGTNIHKAIIEALKLIESSRNTNYGILLPDNIQSIIIFLTDGEPTVGIKGLSEIQTEIKKENENLSVPIFSLAFGTGADFEFLKSLSLQNKAFARKIYEDSDATLQLTGFYNEIASPLLSDLNFIYTSPVYTLSDLTFTYFPNVFNGSEIVIAGKFNTPTALKTMAASTECELQQNGQSLLKMNVKGMGRDGPIDVKDAESYINPECAQITQSSTNFTTPQVSTNSTKDSFTTPQISTHFTEDNFTTPQFPLHFTEDNFTTPQFPLHFTEDNFTTPQVSLHFTEDSFTTPQVSTHFTEDSFMERLWAYLTIQQLTEMDIKGIKRLPISLAINASYRGTPKEKAVLLALEYGFVSAYTSLVVVKPNKTNTVVDVKSSNSGSGGGVSLPQTTPASYIPDTHSRHSTIGFSKIEDPQFSYPAIQYESENTRLMLASPKPSTEETPILYAPAYYPFDPHTLGPAPPVFDSSPTPQARLTLDDIVWLANDEIFLYHDWTDYGIARSATFNDSEGAKCTNGTVSYQGQCRHLQNCVLPEFVASRDVYLSSYFCEIETESLDQYAGVCCPF